MALPCWSLPNFPGLQFTFGPAVTQPELQLSPAQAGITGWRSLYMMAEVNLDQLKLFLCHENLRQNWFLVLKWKQKPSNLFLVKKLVWAGSDCVSIFLFPETLWHHNCLQQLILVSQGIKILAERAKKFKSEEDLINKRFFQGKNPHTKIQQFQYKGFTSAKMGSSCSFTNTWMSIPLRNKGIYGVLCDSTEIKSSYNKRKLHQ